MCLQTLPFKGKSVKAISGKLLVVTIKLSRKFQKDHNEIIEIVLH